MLGHMSGQRGQANVEFALVLIAGLIPLSLGLIAFAELAWTYHSLATLTRQGARYAATHCWVDDAGSNVITWMQNNSPPFLDRPRLSDGGAQIQVAYWTQDFATQESTQFSGSESCSPGAAPDSVTVSISGYQFGHILPTLGFSPLSVPSFATTVEMESVGANQDGGTPEP
ncbi:MAG: pilus assembly protein [Acidobacteria bacterium]|nr:pilus assembly protein [Acidobacteriota bacterium]